MTSPHAAPCPDCGTDLGPGPHARCPHCRLPLTGADAAALWQVVIALRALDEQRGAMLLRRDHLLAGLRARRDVPDPAPVWGAPAFVARHPVGAGGPAVGAAEVSGRSAQTVLLVLGGLLVSVAALVFTVVSWGRLGIAGRSAVLFALTAVALVLPSPLRRRRLTATAEAAAAVGLGFLVLDCYAARAAGLGGLDATDGLGYWAGATALLAAGSAAYGWAQRLRFPLAAGFLLTRLPALLALAAAGVEQVQAYAAAMVAGTVLDTVLLVGAERQADGRLGGPILRRAGAGFAVVWALSGGAVAVLGSVTASGFAGALAAWGPLGVLAGLGTGVALRLTALPREGRLAAAAGAAVAVLAAAGGTLRPLLPADWAGVAYGLPATLLVIGAGAALRRTAERAAEPVDGRAVEPVVEPVEGQAWAGVLAAAGAVLGLASLAAVPRALAAALVPLGHAPAAWAPDGGSFRDWQASWPVPGSALVGLVLIAVAAGALAVLRAVRLPAGVAEAVAVVAGLPAVLLIAPAAGLPYGVSMGWALLLAVLAAGAVALRPGLPAAWAGLGVTDALALTWASADRAATITALGLCTVLAAVVAWRAAVRGGASAATAAAVAAVGAVVSLGAEAAAVGDTVGLAQPSLGLLLLGVAVGTVPVAAVLARRAGTETRAEAGAEAGTDGSALRQVSWAVEGAGCALAAVALALTAGTPGVLSFALAAAGVGAAAVALRADRRAVAGGVATGLLLASSWIRLALWGVTTPEAYTLGLAAAALAVGHLRYRRDPALSSWAGYGPGLGLGLVPSVLALGSDGHWLRPLLLGAGALAATVVGVRLRLQAPLLLGGGALLLTAGHELAPTVVQVLGLLPRWVPLAVAGLLLLALGAGYEQRLRDARRLREGLRRLR
ncbi:SCO7613 C-terminal domain-containing membrane protein [Kitasatospora camelliae]|uniref:Membrane protein DUF2157 n=1 Tax=Kitasatospora camelliae TaxID=3156397 RepID=A0AAU8K341_9ACTN